MTRLALVLAAALAAAPLAAAAQSAEGGARFVAAIRANDCAMTEGEAAAILPGLGFAMEETREYVAILAERGAVSVDEAEDFADDRLRLSDELCAADPAGDAALFAELN